ncbi:hypothetical protein FSPOR_5192 [Fusarium sporotrichioides]|uniref:Uncharacterized protein n=1 Tax=Fusarium sporotrichioides TaxID=5514 RepID=A0A395S8I5_FUSSP|nr:hypothetical protein FSPOR_5192 [Fusarium sporotrichioides]
MTHFSKYKADVIWWDSSSMYIRCPHCDKIHRHGFSGNYHVRHRRAPHCENYESYSIFFPSAGLYEIDSSRGLYVRAGADPAAYFAQFDPTPKVDVSNRRKWTEAREEVEIEGIDFRFNRLKLTVSNMVLGELQNVRSYLETSQEKDLFLHGVDAFTIRYHRVDEGDASGNILEDNQDESQEGTEKEIEETTTMGETALHMAACEQYPEMVKLLLEFGANPNLRSVDGRTPLMEAALWGRLENVKCLLSYGANKSITCIRQGKSLRAIDFAADTRENGEERYDRSGDKDQVYKEVTHERNLDRVAIARELYDEVEGEQNRDTATFSHLNGFALTTIRDGRNIISLLANFDVPNRYKTIGILFRGDIIDKSGFPPVAAMSGWAHQSGLEHNVQIQGRTWTDEVFRLCQLVGHQLPADAKDQGRHGQFNACHAEKQLTAYFISKHVFLSGNSAMDDFGMSSLSLDTSQRDWELQDRLDELRKVIPPEKLQRGTILVSRTHGRVCTFLEAARPRKRQRAANEETSGPAVEEFVDSVSPSSEIMASERETASPASIAPFSDIDMQFFQDLNIDGAEYQFMFQTPDNNSLITESGPADNPSGGIYPLLDGNQDLHPEILGPTGDMDPYLLRHYRTDDNGTLKFKQLAIRSVTSNPPMQFVIPHASLFMQSRQEAGHQPVRTSDAREQLEKTIPQNIGKTLIRLYQKFVAPHYPIFSDESPPDTATSSPCLLAAIYSISLPFAMYDDHLCIDMAYDPPDAKALAELINTGVASEIHSPNIATVQTLFLLVVRPSSNPLVSDASYRWTNMGILVSAAINIGLQLDPKTWNIPSAQASARCRLSFFIYALDKWLAAALGRTPYVTRSNWLVDELTVEDNHSSGLDASQWTHMMTFSAITTHLAATLDRLYSLRSPAADQISYIKSMMKGLSNISDRNVRDNAELEETTHDSPTPLIVNELGHHYIQLLALRAAVHSQPCQDSTTETPGQDTDPRTCFQVALEGFLKFVNNLKTEGAARHWPPWCQGAFSSLSFAVLFMFVSSRTVEEASTWLQLLLSIRKQLRLKASTLEVLRLGLLRIDAIFWRGIDNVLKLEPHVKLALDTLQTA